MIAVQATRCRRSAAATPWASVEAKDTGFSLLNCGISVGSCSAAHFRGWSAGHGKSAGGGALGILRIDFVKGEFENARCACGPIELSGACAAASTHLVAQGRAVAQGRYLGRE